VPGLVAIAIAAAVLVGLGVGFWSAGLPVVRVVSGEGPPAGLFAGLAHGIALPVSFLVRVLTQGRTVYEAHNIGVLYDAGFLLGVFFWTWSTAALKRLEAFFLRMHDRDVRRRLLAQVEAESKGPPPLR